MQFEKLQARRQSKKRCPNCFDLVQDKVVNWSLYAFISFLVFLLIAYNLQAVTSLGSNQASDIKLGIPLPFNLRFQENLSQSRTPTIFVRNKFNQPLEGVKGHIELLSLLAPITESRPQCNSVKLSKLEHTLEWIRFGEICRPVLLNTVAYSNSQGLIQFPDFSIDRGPEGTYVFKYYTSDTVFSDLEQVSVVSQVTSMTVNTAPPLVATVGTVISPQPEVTLTDENGNGVQGKTVIAFAWIDSNFDPDFQDHILVTGNKVAILEGQISQASDSNGVARFTNLKVTGSSVAFVHIFFSVDGKIIEPWLYRPLKPPAPGVPIPPQSRWPIFLSQTVSSVNVVTAPSSTVTEGEVWPVQPKIRVLDGSGNPVAGQVVMAVTYGGLNANAPLGFRNVLDTIPNKHLLNPIEGTYASFEEYLQGTTKAFTPMYTDSNGQVQFTSLKWNTDGIAGSGSPGRYVVLFVCNGEFSSAIQQQVLSRIATIQFSKPLETAYRVSSNSEFDGTIRIRVTDSNGDGVSGKYVTGDSHTVTAPNSDSDIVITSRNDIEEFSVSDANGFMAIPFKINIVKKSTLQATFTFNVDDSSVTSSSITMNGNLGAVPDSCAYIETQTAPPSTTTNGNQFTPVFKAMKQDGNPWVGGTGTLGVYFTPEYPYKIKRQVINNIDASAATATSSATGVLTFTNFKFIQQPVGTTFLQVQGTNADVANCKSDFQVVTVQVTINEISLLSPTNAQLGNFDKTIPLDTDQATTIRLLDDSGNPITGTTVTLSLQIAHMPVNLFQEYFASGVSTTFFTLSSTSLTSDGSGDITFNWKLGKGRSGYWTIIFMIDGKFTDPFSFKTTWDAGASVTIITQPVVNSGNQPVGEYLDSNGGAVIEVKDSSNNPMENFMVSTTLIPVDGAGNKDTSASRKQGMLDIYTTTLQDVEDHDQAGTLAEIAATFITLTGEKNGKTNAAGRVTLNQLTMMDVQGDAAACYKFFFFIGTYEGGDFRVSAASDSVCFINQIDVSITSIPSSKIAPNQVFSTPVTMRITKSTASDSDKTGLIIYTGTVSSVNRIAVSNKYFGAQSYFENNVCIFYNKASVGGGCTDLNVINDGTTGSYIAETSFSGIIYTQINNVELLTRFSTPFQFDSQYIQSSKINVIIDAENIEFVEQPPSSIKLEEVFQVKVKATLSNGSPMSFVQVFANVTASSTVSSFTNSIFSYAANLQTTINNLNQLSATNNIRLNREGASALTNNAGIATLTLQITGGVSGSYTVMVSSGSNVQSSPSNAFTFQNDINAATSVQNLEQTHDVTKQTISNTEVYQLTLNPQPVVSVTKADGTKVTNVAAGFQIFVIQQADVLSAYNNLGLATGAPNPGIAAILQNISQPSSQSDQALETVTSSWTIFTKGASNIGAVSKKALSSGATFTNPTLNSDNNYVFSDLTIRVTTASKYQLIFMVDGVQTNLTENVQVNDKAVATSSQVARVLIIIATFILLFFLLYSVITSNAYSYSKCMNLAYIIVSLLFCFAFLVVTIMDSYTLTLKIFMALTLALILTSLIYAAIQLFSPKCRKYIFYVEWEKSARQYTYQKLFKRPSNKWMAEKGKPGSFTDRVKVQNGASHNQLMGQSSIDKNQEIQLIASPQNSKNDYTQYGQFQFFKKKIVKRFFDLLIPFQISGNRLNLGDCFFYPQRFFIGFIIAFFGFIFIAVNLFLLIVRVRNSIQALKRNVVETIYAFVRLGVKNIYTWVKLDVVNPNINPFVATSNTIEDFLNKLELAFFIGSIFATVIGTLVMLASIITLFYDYKKRVLQARVGYWPYPKRRFSIINSTSYVGGLISTFLLGYAVIVVLLTLVFIPLCHPVTYRLIWAYRATILAILLPTIINAVLKIIAKKCCVAKTHVRYRRCFAILDLFLLYTAIPAGIVTGLVRFIIMLVVGILTLSKIDTPIAPMWIMNRIMWIDFPNGAYNGLILEHHTHRNPILTTAMYTFLSCLQPANNNHEKISTDDEKNIQLTRKGRRVAHRLQVALLLINNPSLIKYRKHNLPPKKKKKNKKKKGGTQHDFQNLNVNEVSASRDPIQKLELEPFSEHPQVQEK